MSEEAPPVAVLLKERRIFEPPAELVEQSNVKKWMDEHGRAALRCQIMSSSPGFKLSRG